MMVHTSSRLRGLTGLPLDQQHRLRAGLEHASTLGMRAMAELLVQVLQEGRDLPATLDLLDEWRFRLTPELVSAVGGDRFPPRPLKVAHG